MCEDNHQEAGANSVARLPVSVFISESVSYGSKAFDVLANNTYLSFLYKTDIEGY